MCLYPSVDIKINDDSILYYRSQHPFTMHIGLFKYKLSEKEFSRIQKMFNRIRLEDIKLEPPHLDVNYYYIFIKTKNKEEFKSFGMLKKNRTEDIDVFFDYLSNLERTKKLNKIGSLDDKIAIKTIGEFYIDKYY